MAGNIVPRSDGGCNLGTPAKEFDKIYAKDIGGTLATKLAPLASPVLTGVPAAPTAAAGTSTTQIATTAFAAAAVSAHNADTGAHSGIIGSAVSTHNSSAAAHSDIRTKIGTDISTHNTAADAHASRFTCPIADWVAGTSYAVKDIRIKDGKIYQCNTANSDAAFDAAKWQALGLSDNGFKVGDIKSVAYNGDIEEGWMLCDGASLTRTLYAVLFAKIGTTYGSADDTHFNLPDLTDKFVEGSTTAGTAKSAGLPNIKGNAYFRSDVTPFTSSTDGVLRTRAATSPASVSYFTLAGSGNLDVFDIDASRASSIYGSSTTVQPPALTMRYLIKYE